MVVKKINGKYALVSAKDQSKVLEWYGTQPPSKERVLKSERRVQFFKNKLVYVKPHSRRGIGSVRGYVRSR